MSSSKGNEKLDEAFKTSEKAREALRIEILRQEILNARNSVKNSEKLSELGAASSTLEHDRENLEKLQQRYLDLGFKFKKRWQFWKKI